jgi:hypothetical protein
MECDRKHTVNGGGGCRACRDEGYNPFGQCESGHAMLRGGCIDCGADMMADV